MATLHDFAVLARRRWAGFNRLTKIVGAFGTFLGFATAVVSAYHGIATYLGHRTEAREQLAVADRELAAGEYQKAWQANAKALELAAGTGAAGEQQTTIALRWLENMMPNSATGPATFAAAVAPLEPVLVRNETGAGGSRLADIEAHVGWAHFLDSRDGTSPVDVGEEFDAAIRADPQNMYGHLYRGFWTLWRGGTLADARADLDTAFASDRDPAYSDRLVIAAMLNTRSDENLSGALDYANRLRKAGRDITGLRTRADILTIYEMGLTDPGFLKQLAGAIPFDDQIATLDWILASPIADARRPNAKVLQAYFLERSGNTAAALAAYRSIASEAPKYGSNAGDFAQAGITRLGTPKPSN